MHARSRLPATTTKTSHDDAERRSRSKSAIKTSRLVQPVLRAAGRRRCSFDSPSKRFEYLHRNELRSSLPSLLPSFFPSFLHLPLSSFFPPMRMGRQRTFHVFAFHPRRAGSIEFAFRSVLTTFRNGNFSKRMIFIESRDLTRFTRSRERLSRAACKS